MIFITTNIKTKHKTKAIRQEYLCINYPKSGITYFYLSKAHLLCCAFLLLTFSPTQFFGNIPNFHSKAHFKKDMKIET